MPDLMNEFGLRMHWLLPMTSFFCLSQFLVSFYRCCSVVPPTFPFIVCNLPFSFLLVIRKQAIEFPSSITCYTTYLSHCTDQIPDRKQCKGGRGYFVLKFEGTQTIMVGNIRLQEPDRVSHIASIVRKEKEDRQQI